MGVKERKTMVDPERDVGQDDRAWPPIIGCRGIADIIAATWFEARSTNIHNYHNSPFSHHSITLLLLMISFFKSNMTSNGKS